MGFPPAFVASPASAFNGTRLSRRPQPATQPARRPHFRTAHRPLCTIAQADSLGLTPKLRDYVTKFSSVRDPKLRYQQLLFFARQLPAMDESLKTDANRVHGCTSVVHVNVTVDSEGLVRLEGDSDAQLTKGLLALLVNGLSGFPPANVLSVDPRFIAESGLTVSLTPSRNNGFVSMVAKIKEKVSALVAQEQAGGGPMSDAQAPAVAADADGEQSAAPAALEEDPARPVYSAIVRKLSVLKPRTLNVIDNSAQHAGHAGAKGLDGESHFAVEVVSEAFDGLRLVQRHQVIYTLLKEEMSNGYIHALEINARTPAEVAS